MKSLLVCIVTVLSFVIAPSARAVNQQSKEAYGKGALAAMNNNLPEADRQFKIAVELDPKNLDALNAWGVILSKQGRYKESYQKFETATKTDPKFAKSWYNWGVALMEAGDKKDAAVKFQRTATLKPDFSSAYENWGLVLIDLGQKQQGIKKLKLAAKYDPKKAQRISGIIKDLEDKNPLGHGRR
ncbi:MAG: tetratricopeptide repeat protein [Nitrospirota bacterium]